MKTGSFKTFKGPGAISIARSAGRGFRGPKYPSLAPGPWFKTASKEEYLRRFEYLLNNLSPVMVWREIHELTAPHEPVLLCWEVPPFDDQDNWCHRRLVADWFEKAGQAVAELKPSMELLTFESPPELGGPREIVTELVYESQMQHRPAEPEPLPWGRETSATEYREQLVLMGKW